MLELFVIYPTGAAWTAELVRRRDGAEQWTTVFSVTLTSRDTLMRNIGELWPRVTWTELRPVIQ
jgi:hypothetical protein